MPLVKKPIGEILVDNGQITPEELALATREAKSTGEPMSVVLARLGLAYEHHLKNALELQYGCTYVSLARCPLDYDLLTKLPESLMREHLLVPVSELGNRVTVAMVDPNHTEGLGIAKVAFAGKQIMAAVCTEDEFIIFMETRYKDFLAQGRPSKKAAETPAAKEAQPATKVETAKAEPAKPAQKQTLKDLLAPEKPEPPPTPAARETAPASSAPAANGARARLDGSRVDTGTFAAITVNEPVTDSSDVSAVQADAPQPVREEGPAKPATEEGPAQPAKDEAPAKPTKDETPAKPALKASDIDTGQFAAIEPEATIKPSAAFAEPAQAKVEESKPSSLTEKEGSTSAEEESKLAAEAKNEEKPPEPAKKEEDAAPKLVMPEGTSGEAPRTTASLAALLVEELERETLGLAGSASETASKERAERAGEDKPATREAEKGKAEPAEDKNAAARKAETEKSEPVEDKKAAAKEAETGKTEPVEDKKAAAKEAETEKSEPVEDKRAAAKEAETEKAEPVQDKKAAATEAEKEREKALEEEKPASKEGATREIAEATSKGEKAEPGRGSATATNENEIVEPPKTYEESDGKQDEKSVEPVESKEDALTANLGRYYSPTSQSAKQDVLEVWSTGEYKAITPPKESAPEAFPECEPEPSAAAVRVEPQDKKSMEAGIKEAEDAAVIMLCNQILANAIAKGASTVHIEAQERQVLVHYRIAGQLMIVRKLPRILFSALAARFRRMGRVDMQERMIPQDGRIKVRMSGKDFSLRLSIIPGRLADHIVVWID
ncbi:MAG TPA: ATPase, T2SS/T4P/T4SS family [Candidatus Obscuribacterales bacterium]